MSAAVVDLAGAVEERRRVLASFLEMEASRIALACHDMARAFATGGTLVPFGTGAAASDAAHVAVEFMHPVIVGKRALPAVASPSLAGPADIAMGLVHGPRDLEVEAFLERSRALGALTIAFTRQHASLAADHVFAVPSEDPTVVQEVQETAYHVLWELVHVFFEHPGLLGESCITCGDVAVEVDVVAVEADHAVVERGGARETVAVDLVPGVKPGDRLLCHAGVALERLEGEPTDFLYPFLGAGERDLAGVLAEVRESTVAKGRDVIALRAGLDLGAVAACGEAIAAALHAGGRLLTFGNGGSATDAQDAALDAGRLGWPAVALVDDPATITAVGNDVGFENVFARQLIALGRPGDVALAVSTSGSSPNIVAGLEEAHRRGMLTCAIVGYDGGRVARLDSLDHLVVVRGDYVPRLQEAQATVYHLMLEIVGRR